jgi:Fe-S-cluster containining protein
MGNVLCEHCTAVCCRYIALPIDKPRTRRDFDDLRWYLMHENISIFVEQGDWYIQFYTRCRNLQADNRCGIYPTRPEICREYQAGDCDYCGGDYGYEHWFTDAAQIEAYAGQRFALRAARAPRAARRRRTGRPMHTHRHGAPPAVVPLGVPRRAPA